MDGWMAAWKAVLWVGMKAEYQAGNWAELRADWLVEMTGCVAGCALG
jgi:hypothetical protein